MDKKIDAVKMQREIRSKLSEKYAKSRTEELQDLKSKFEHLRRKKVGTHSR